MVVQFKTVKLYNFCSYNYAEVNLLDKGFCAVSGKNNCKKDNAVSNGSGKSTLWSAICYALTGETLAGIKTNLKNLYSSETSSYVELNFNVNTDNYILTRYCAPKNDLKIIKNSVDISGKSIRDSEKRLAEELPDLKKDLICSTILLGQGMPNKFSSFTPSGRKELLEKLTKSDFMIEDIKSRISTRLATLNDNLRIVEDGLLVNKTQLQSDTAQLETAVNSLNSLIAPDFSTLIPAVEKEIAELQKTIDINNQKINALDSEIEKTNSLIISKTAEKAKINDEELNTYSVAFNDANTKLAVNQTNIDFVQQEIKRLKSIKDVCPTCGQKIPGVLKPDTTEQETKAKKLLDEKVVLTENLQKISEKHKQYLDEIEKAFSNLITLQQTLKDYKQEVLDLRDSQLSVTATLANKNTELIKLNYDKDNIDKISNNIKTTVNNLTAKIKAQNDIIDLNTKEKELIEEHIATVKKIETLVKRDFRGYLLYNIIDYLNKKAKDYSQIVFETNALNIYLDGNALDISYDGKLYESLSGGEKQRVDLITQFAIRDLLQTYFNYSSNILVLDEITDNLDRVATSKIFDLITTKLKDVESVFIISHHSDELKIPVDSEIIVTKDVNGISTVKEN